jgi:5-methylcytosine-specific restriction endonuclease McrA
MRIEIVIFLIAGFLILNIYSNGLLLKKAVSYKKYYQMLGVAFGALFVYYLVKKNPMNTREIIQSTNEYIKYLPIDSENKDFLSPILDFSSKSFFNADSQPNHPVVSMNGISGGGGGGSGVRTTKRVVSETKKKFVAARQNWRCGSCKQMLKSNFQVDHTVRLDAGGSNHIDNLVAMCILCHSDKTLMENL